MRLSQFSKVLGFLVILNLQTAFAGLFSPKPWCDSWLSRDPREIQVFKQDMAKARTLSTTTQTDMFAEVQDQYGKNFVAELDKVFAKPRYLKMAPEVRARLISYTLVRMVRITHPRGHTIVPLSKWLMKILDESKDFSVEDLERLRLSFAIFLNRRAGYLDRNHTFLEAAGPTALDVGATLLVDWKFAAMTAALLPHIGLSFLPFPIFTLSRLVWAAAFKKVGDPLDEGSLHAANLMDRKFMDMIGAHIDLKEIKDRWDKNLKQIVRKNGEEITEGIVDDVTKEYCELGKRMHAVKPGDTIEIFAHMARSLVVMNPIDWEKIYSPFVIIRQSARQLGIGENEASEIFKAMREVANTWESNAHARRTVDDMLKTSFSPQLLPEQSDQATLAPAESSTKATPALDSTPKG